MNSLKSKNNQASNKFLPVIYNWKDYFRHRDEGIGTLYERLMLHRIFERINQVNSIETVLEVPSFGITGISGINSMWWADKGKKVTIIDSDLKRIQMIKKIWKETALNVNVLNCIYNDISLKSNSVDLVWNFAALWFTEDLTSFLNDLKRISCKIIFICVPNTHNVFFKLRKLLFGKKTELNFKNIRSNRIKQEIVNKQWHLAEEGFFDVPPWPDIPVRKDVILSKFKLDLLFSRQAAKNSVLNILDFFTGKESNLGEQFRKWQFLENSPAIIQKFWAHHQYFIFKRF